VAGFNAENTMLKKGLALTPAKFGISFTLTHLNQAGALVHVYTDGSVQVNHGGTEMGQGVYIKVAQVVAEVFGITIDRVQITATTTSKVPNTTPTAASSGSDLNGMAASRAAQAIKRRMADVAARALGASAGDVTFAGNRVFAGDREMSFGEVAKKGVPRPHPAVGHRLLRHAQDQLEPRAARGAAVLLLRLWRGVLGGHRRRDHRRNAR
jgi:xanthine dehydrogenase large subunit